MRRAVAAFLSVVSLASCLVFAVLHFKGGIGIREFKTLFLLASAAWYTSATAWLWSKKKL